MVSRKNVTDKAPATRLERIAEIVRIQAQAVELQAACKWMPPENFFANMIGHMGIVYGPDTAAGVLTLFEMTRQDHEEMFDDMIRDPVGATAALNEGIKNFSDRLVRRGRTQLTQSSPGQLGAIKSRPKK